MSRAARRRAQREAESKPQQRIELRNPVTAHFEAFIFGNSLKCEHVAVPDSKIGRTLTICGAGPSLVPHAERTRETDDVWACNSAMPWLIEHGYPVTHGVTVDQTPAMVNEWRSAPDVEYLVASTIHPHLTEHLLERGRRLTWFHNFVGLAKPPVVFCECGHDHELSECGTRYESRCVQPDECECAEYRPRMIGYEDWLYITLYPLTIRAGSGLNTVTRAIDLALVMGYDRIQVLGADCALHVKSPLPKHVKQGSAAHRAWLQSETVMHADGGHALASGATPVTIEGDIDGRLWVTKPDMAISAVFMLRLQEAIGVDRLEYVGDTLPNALRGKSDDFIARLPTLMGSDGKPIPVERPAPLQAVAPSV